MNINDVDPSAITPDTEDEPSPAAGAPAALPTNIHAIDPSAIQSEDEYNQSTYGTPGQTALAVGEAASRGLIGRAATAGLERLSGLPGLSPEAQAGREAVNPVLSPTVEGAGFVGGALLGTGEAAVINEIGEGARAATGIAEGARLLPRVAATGIQTGAEFAALAADNELAKTINQDPGQSLGTAALNIGLAGVLGGAGGAVLGSVAPLWRTATNKIGVEKLASDFMGESEFLRQNPDPVAGAALEINDRLASTDQLIGGGLKKNLIAKLAEDVTPEQLGSHVAEINQAIEAAPPSLKNEPAFQEAVEKWKSAIFRTPEPVTIAAPETVTADYSEIPPTVLKAPRPTATRIAQMGEAGAAADAANLEAANRAGFNPYETPKPAPVLAPAADVFSATENFKRQLQEWAKYNKDLVPIAERPFRNASSRLATTVKESLENQKMWGAAAGAQKAYNAAINPLFDIQKEFLGKFSSKELGEKVADPAKINTYLNQAEKTKAGLKTNYVKNYLDQTQKAADAINHAYLENGLEQPLEERLNPTPILDHSLNTPPSAGINLARWVNRGGAAKMAGREVGELGAAGVGAGLGSLVGHPLVGAWMGEKVLTPLFSALAKPLAQTAINATAAKASVDYVGNVIKGQRLLSTAAANLFKAGTEIIPKELLPNVASREKLEKSLEYAGNPQNQMQIGGSIGHYLPEHATAAAQTAAQATNYFAALKPKAIQLNQLDLPTSIDPGAAARYDRQLDVATQPLLVLKHARSGTLQQQDLATIDTVFPGLRPQIAKQAYGEMVKAISGGEAIAYKQRMSLSMLMGQPLDSTQTQPLMASVMAANAPAGPPQPLIQKQKKVSKSTASTMEKGVAMLQTPDQARASGRTEGHS